MRPGRWKIPVRAEILPATRRWEATAAVFLLARDAHPLLLRRCLFHASLEQKRPGHETASMSLFYSVHALKCGRNECIFILLFHRPSQDNTNAARGYKDNTPAVQRGIAWKPGGGFGWHEIGKMERPHYSSKRWNDVQARVHSLRMPGGKTSLSPKKARKVKPLLHRSPTVRSLWDVDSLKQY